MFVDELMCGDTFMVTQSCLQDVPMILGWRWQHNYNCFFNWRKNLAHCQSDNNRIWVPLCPLSKDGVSDPTTNLEKAPITIAHDKEFAMFLSTPASSKKENNDNRKNKEKQTNQNSIQFIPCRKIWILKATMEVERGEQYVWIPK